ncbi:MAG: SIS domain-containing protein, partial [Pseudomonadota bacterium]
ADSRDTLIAMSARPYRSEIIAAIDVAREQNMTIIGISDSPASPVIRAANHGFVACTDSLQFFPSSVTTIALLETLLSFVISVASDEIVDRVEKFHRRRHQLGIYVEEPE